MVPAHFSRSDDEHEKSFRSHADETSTTSLSLQQRPNFSEPTTGHVKKEARRSDRRILSRPDGIISNIEDATYTVLRKHAKGSS